MAQFVYIDETGSVGSGGKKQDHLMLVAVIVDEANVRQLAAHFKRVAFSHLGWIPADFEFHGVELWGGTRHWAGKTPSDLIAAYEDALSILPELEISVAHSSIHKARLHRKYNGSRDQNAYRLALQFLLEKVDRLGPDLKVVVADEAKEQQLAAVKLVANLQEWGGGEVPGRTLTTVIDSLHFVRSDTSPGVQLADLVAFAIQRKRYARDSHPDAQAAIQRICDLINLQTRTWREAWP
jgi:hypothetical protein